MFIVRPNSSLTCQHKMQPHCTMLECLEISKNRVAKDHLLQLQEVDTTLSHYLHDAQSTQKTCVDQNHLDSSQEQPKF